MDKIGLRAGNTVLLDSNPIILTYEQLSDSDIRGRLEGSPMSDFKLKTYRFETNKEREGVMIRRSQLQDGWCFVYRKTAIKFFQYVHEFENLYYDFKGKFPEKC